MILLDRCFAGCQPRGPDRFGTPLQVRALTPRRARRNGHRKNQDRTLIACPDGATSLENRGLESAQSKRRTADEHCVDDVRLASVTQPTVASAVELERLGDQIAEMSAHLDAATARLL